MHHAISPTSHKSNAEARIAACAMDAVIRRARVTIELTAPMHVGSGSEEGDSDAGIVYDGNRLAAIPGSSIKGVLRHAYELRRQEDPDLPDASAVFGRMGQEGEEGEGGRLSVSWAHVHDENDKPVDRPLSRDEVVKDPVLRRASEPETRDHVRLDHRGTAAKHGKFDELHAAPGLRFTFDLEFRGGVDADGNSDEGDQRAWDFLLMTLADPLLRFGGRNRRGFGCFKVIRHDHRAFRLDGIPASPDLWDDGERDPKTEWRLFSGWPVGLENPHRPQEDREFFHNLESWLEAEGDAPPPRAACMTYQCELRAGADTLWMIGGQNDDSPSDSSPLKTRRITWSDRSDGTTSGSEETVWVIPGSAVKGCLRHRTVFHYSRLTGRWAAESGISETGEEAVDAVFGYVRYRKEGRTGLIAPDEVASPGLVFIDDILAPAGAKQAALQNHVAIDRVLGGAMDHLLFDDQPLVGGAFAFTIRIATPLGRDIPEHVLEAFVLALDDLCHGRLALGAHAGRGYGFFEGSHQLVTPTASTSDE